ncbi:phage tail assembly chaperone G [Heyndrickxia sp. FSL W8-0423]|uniref:phage tail assembly chaperone G n=1 Tax=Heyndrickxia sp. FSL W8-0423 TaxID=2921601 RepID=UPI0030F7DD65
MANLKRNMIELVKEVKEGEVVTEKYLTPVFIPLSVVYEALDLVETIDKSLSGEIDANEEIDLMDQLLNFVSSKLYGNQFTKDELFNGLHGPDAIETLQEQILFIARGRQSDETKKYLAEKNR